MKKGLHEQAEEIRRTSLSIHEAVQRMQGLWLSAGYKVTFTSYPREFGYAISNSHNAPEGYKRNWGRRPGLPTGYPGWSGRWCGKVEKINNSGGKIPGIADLSSGTRHLPAASWIKTGSGSCGDDFSMDGMIFLYDFPAIEQQYKDNGEIYDIMDNEYSSILEDYSNQFRQEKNRAVEADPRFIEAKRLCAEATTLAAEANTLLGKAVDHLRGEFTDKYLENVPTPTSMFVDDKATAEAVTLAAVRKVPPPELEPTLKYAEAVATKMAAYRLENPEIFI